MIKNRISEILSGMKGVFFDMDGVLYDSMGAHADAWSKAFLHYGIDFPPAMVYLNEGRTAQSTINLVFQQNEDRLATDQEIEQIYSKKTEIISAYPEAVPFGGALALMADLKMEGKAIWVVTGSSQDKYLEALLRDFKEFVSAERIISGKNVIHGKPHPEPYLAALNKSGFLAHEVLVIENAPLGVQSAKAAGIFTLAVNTGVLEDRVLWEAGADIVIQDLNELKL